MFLLVRYFFHNPLFYQNNWQISLARSSSPKLVEYFESHIKCAEIPQEWSAYNIYIYIYIILFTKHLWCHLYHDGIERVYTTNAFHVYKIAAHCAKLTQFVQPTIQKDQLKTTPYVCDVIHCRPITPFVSSIV